MNRKIELNPKSTRWIFLFNGLVNSVIGLRIILQMESWIHLTSILGIFLIIGGPILFLYGIILFNPSNKLTPTFQIDDVGLKINRDIFKKVICIDWISIQEITFKTFELDFKLENNDVETVTLPTTADKSIEIKKVIREFCEKKEIKIIGG